MSRLSVSPPGYTADNSAVLDQVGHINQQPFAEKLSNKIKLLGFTSIPLTLGMLLLELPQGRRDSGIAHF